MAADHRLPRSAVAGAASDFDVLQALHEAAAGCLEHGRLDELTPGMRALTVLFAYAGGVDNGGFASCMYNSTGDWTAEAIWAARHIGADPHAEVFERFAEVGLGGDLAMDWEARNERLESMSDADESALEQLDEQFYALPSIDDALTRYLREHPDEFFTD